MGMLVQLKAETVAASYNEIHTLCNRSAIALSDWEIDGASVNYNMGESLTISGESQ